MAECRFNTIRERDMDLLFVERAMTDIDFIRLLVSKTDLKGSEVSIVHAELSRTEYDLGESDITLILKVDDKRYGFLIEDKIDAIAMPEQYSRYIERGKVGIKNKEYEDFRIIIFCPEKYYSSDAEAKLYEHHLSYEEVADYLRSQTDELSKVHLQAITQAIDRAKKPPHVVLNEAVNLYFRQYRMYQQAHFPDLDIRTKETSNGWWVDYNTALQNVIIINKTQEGYADLTFPHAADRLSDVKAMADWLREHGVPSVHGVKTGKSAALRIEVPKLAVKQNFETTPEKNLKACFEAIHELNQIAKLLADFLNVKDAFSKK